MNTNTKCKSKANKKTYLEEYSLISDMGRANCCLKVIYVFDVFLKK